MMQTPPQKLADPTRASTPGSTGPVDKNEAAIAKAKIKAICEPRTVGKIMLIVRNDTRAADIYFGEFMRLHTHYAFREAVAIHQTQNPGGDWKPNNLISDATWQTDYFKPGNSRFLRREYFAGK